MDGEAEKGRNSLYSEGGRSHKSMVLSELAPWLDDEHKLGPHEEAALLLEYAREGQELTSYELTVRSRNCYRLRKKNQLLYRVTVWALIIVYIFSYPVWTFHVDEEYSDGEVFPSYRLPFMPVPLSITLEAIAWLILWSAVLTELGYKLQTRNRYLTFIFLLVVSVETLQSLLSIMYTAAGWKPEFSLSPGRALLILLIERKYENYITYVLNLIPRFLLLLSAVAVMVVAFTSLGFQLFSPSSEEAQQYFNAFGNGLWTMLMVLVSSDWPGPMMPAMNSNHIYFLYFFAFVVIVDWGMINLVLGFVYVMFRVEQEEITTRHQRNMRQYLRRAFRLLDTNGCGHLSYRQVDALLLELYTFYVKSLKPPSEDERYELILQLDKDGSQKISCDEFLGVINTCHLRALKELRAKKARFFRYLNANVDVDSSSNQDGVGVHGSHSRVTMNGGLSSQVSVSNKYKHPHPCTFSSGGDNPQENNSGATEPGPANMALRKVSVHDLIESVTVGSMHRTLSAATQYGGIQHPVLLSHYFDHTTKHSITRDANHTVLTDRLAYFIDTKTFDTIVDSLLLLIAIAIFIDTFSEACVFLYTALSGAEVIAKFVVKGHFRYRRSYKNMCDAFVTVVLLGTMVICGNTSHQLAPNVCILWFVLFRSLLYPRNVLASSAFTSFRHKHRHAFRLAFQASSHIMFLLYFMMVMLIFAAAVGMQLFGGTIRKEGGNSAAIYSSSYGGEGYWPQNFNDLPSGIVTLFMLLQVNNMHITTAGMVAATNLWAELFFALWYCFGVLLLLNILIAVFLNHFVSYLQVLMVNSDEKSSKPESSSDNERQPNSQEIEMTSEPEGPAVHALLDPSAVAVSDHNAPPATAVLTAPTDATTDQGGVTGRDSAGIQVGLAATAIRDGGLTAGIQKPSISSLASVSALTPKRSAPAGVLQRFVARSNVLSGTPISQTPTMATPGRFIIDRRDSVDADSVDNPGSFAISPFASPFKRQRLLLALQAQTPRSPAHTQMSSSLATHRLASAVSSAPRSSSYLFNRDSQTYGTNQSFNSRQLHPSSEAENQRWSSLRTGTAASPVQASSQLEEKLLSQPSEQLAVRARFIPATFGDKVQDDGKEIPRDRNPPVFSAHAGVDDDMDQPIHIELELDLQASGIGVNPVVGGGSRPGTSKPFDPYMEHAIHGALFRHATTEDAPLQPPHGMRSMLSRLSFSDPKPQPANLNAVSNPVHSDPEPRISSPPQFSGEDVQKEEPGESQSQARAESWREPMSLHESNLLQHLRAHQLPVRPMSKSLYNLMYGEHDVSTFEKAAILVQFAREGSEHSIFSSQRSLACYKLRNKLSPLFKAVAFLYTILKVFERPHWSYYKDDWQDDSIFPNSGIQAWSSSLVSGVKLVLISVLLFGLALEYGFQEKRMSAFNVCRLLLAAYAVAVWCVCVFALAHPDAAAQALTTDGAVAFVLWFNRRSLNKFRLVLNILPRFSFFLGIFGLFVLICAIFGPPIYGLSHLSDDDDSNQYFDTFFDSLWSVFTAITSSSYPSQFMPAYRQFRDVAIYLVSVTAFGSFGLLNVLIVVVLVEFQRGAVSMQDKQKVTRQILLMRAFEVLDERGEGAVDKEHVRRLLDELYEFYADFKKAGIPQGLARDLLIDILDVDGDGRISLDDFLFILDVVRIKISVDSKATLVDIHLPALAATQAFQCFRRTVSTRAFDVAVDLLGALLLLCSLVANSHDVYHPSASSVAVTVCLCALYSAEVACHVLASGVHKYVRSFRHVINCGFTAALLLALIAALATDGLFAVTPATQCLKIVLMARLILLPRNLRFVAGAHNAHLAALARLLRRIVAKITTLSIVFLCSGYAFVFVGMMLFGGRVDKTNSALGATDYAENGYWPLNFNDFTSACVTLFSCLKVSDFDVVADGFVAVTSRWARLYFAVWYAVGVLLFLNIIKAVFLGEFLMLFGHAGLGAAPTKASQVLAKDKIVHCANQTSSEPLEFASSGGDWGEGVTTEPLSGRTLSFSSAQVKASHLTTQIVGRLAAWEIGADQTVGPTAVQPCGDYVPPALALPPSSPLRALAPHSQDVPIPLPPPTVEEDGADLFEPSSTDLSPEGLMGRETFYGEVRARSADMISPDGRLDQQKRRGSASDGLQVYASTSALKHSDHTEKVALKKRIGQLAALGFAPEERPV